MGKGKTILMMEPALVTMEHCTRDVGVLFLLHSWISRYPDVANACLSMGNQDGIWIAVCFHMAQLALHLLDYQSYMC